MHQIRSCDNDNPTQLEKKQEAEPINEPISLIKWSLSGESNSGWKKIDSPNGILINSNALHSF